MVQNKYLVLIIPTTALSLPLPFVFVRLFNARYPLRCIIPGISINLCWQIEIEDEVAAEISTVQNAVDFIVKQ